MKKEANGRSINCMCTNIRSIMNKEKREELQCILVEREVAVLGVTESWTHAEISDAEIKMVGYNVFRKDRNCELGRKKRGGGVLLYVREDLIAHELENDDSKVEVLVVNLKVVGFGNLVMAVCYRSPSAEQEEVDSMMRLLKKYSEDATIIMGDFNYGDINWETMDTTAEGGDFIDFVQDCFLTQHVNCTTRGSNRILDLVLSTEPGMVEDIEVGCPVANSDHCLISFKIPIGEGKADEDNKGSSNIRGSERLNFQKADYDKIKEELVAVDWGKCLQGENVDLMWEKIKDEVNRCIRTYVPRKEFRKRKYARWMKRKILRLVKLKEKQWKKFKERPSHENQLRYKKTRNEVCNEIRKAKADFEGKIAERIKEDPKSFYAYAREKSKVRVGIGPLKWKDKMVENSLEMARVLNEYFGSVFTREDTINIPLGNFESLKHELTDIDITKEKVSKAIDQMKKNKAAGVDGFDTTFVKGSSKGLMEPLVALMKGSLENAVVPEDWKTANVTAIYKKGDKGNPVNYRPVSLTSNVGKIMERIIKDEIVTLLEKNQSIRNSQHGFRHRRSCLTNLLTFMEKIAEDLDSGEAVDVIYLDFQKAFDKVPHLRLLVKLKEIGVRGRVLDWIAEWLNGRKQRVVINGETSEWEDVLSGVPQGSILGPLLFLVYINDIDNGLIGNILKFADDTKIYGKVGTSQGIEALRKDLESLSEWSDKWQMKFNIDKCKVMHFGAKNPEAEYNMNNVKLEVISEEKDLGVIISNTFKVSKQCAKAANKGNQILGLIKRTFISKEKNVLLNLYKALVRPHLEYCIQAWRPHLVKDINLIEKVQRRATRMIMECRGKTYDERLKLLGLMTLETRRFRADMLEVFKILKGFEGLREDSFFRVQCTKTRGHSLKLYKERVNKDVLKFSFGNRVIDQWNNLPEEVINTNSINSFKNRIDNYIRNKMGDS
jgi:ribonucleases P/MRP protein subunit RPP40